MLRIEGITAGYGDLVILEEVSLSMQEKEIIAIVGSNGAGKSTLLRVISCFIKASKGKITFNEEEISSLPSYKIVNKGIVQVPEARQLFPLVSIRSDSFCKFLETKRFGTTSRGLEAFTHRTGNRFQRFTPPTLSDQKPYLHCHDSSDAATHSLDNPIDAYGLVGGRCQVD